MPPLGRNVDFEFLKVQFSWWQPVIIIKSRHVAPILLFLDTTQQLQETEQTVISVSCWGHQGGEYWKGTREDSATTFCRGQRWSWQSWGGGHTAGKEPGPCPVPGMLRHAEATYPAGTGKEHMTVSAVSVWKKTGERDGLLVNPVKARKHWVIKTKARLVLRSVPACETVKGNFQDTKGGWREQPEVRTLCLELWALPSTTGDFGQVSFSGKPLWLTPL